MRRSLPSPRLPATLTDAEIEAEVNLRVTARIEALEQKLLHEMAVAGERRLREAAAVVGNQMERRVGTLERNAETQLRALAEASQSSDARAKMIDAAASTIQARLQKIEQRKIPAAPKRAIAAPPKPGLFDSFLTRFRRS